MWRNCTLYLIVQQVSNETKKIMFLMKQWTINKKIDVSWMFTEPGHRMLLEDGVGTCIKQTIKDTIPDNSNSTISIT